MFLKKRLARVLYIISHAPLQCIFVLFNFLVAFWCYSDLFGVTIFTSILSLLCFVPFYESIKYIRGYLRLKNKAEKRFYNVKTIAMIVPYLVLCFFIGMFCLCISLEHDYPIRDFNHYWKAFKRINSSFEPGNLLPRRQSDTMKFSRFYYTEGILQGGSDFILEVKTDVETIQDYKERLHDLYIDVDEDTLHLLRESGIDGSYNLDTYEIYYLKARCVGNGYCNHGEDVHIAIREKSNEMTFYYSIW